MPAASPIFASARQSSQLADQRWIAFPEPPGRPEVSAAYGRRVLEDAGITAE